MFDNYQALLILGLSFASAIVLIEGIYFFWKSLNVPGNMNTRRRLRKLSAAGVDGKDIPSLLRQQALSRNAFLNRVYLAIPRFHYIDKLLQRASPKTSLSRYFMSCLVFGLAVSTGVIIWVGADMSLAIMAGVLSGVFIPYIVLQYYAQKYVADFNRQLPDAVDFIARSLRAGNPFSASLKAVAEDMADPISTEFGTTFDEMRYGVDVEAALHNLAERTGSEEIRFFVTAVLVQRTTGGNLAKILDRLSAVMRARSNAHRETLILSTEMRYSANILIALPFFVAGAILIVDPSYLAALFESSLGLTLVGLQFLLIGIGYYIIRKMVSFKI